MALGLGGHAEAAGNLANLDAAAVSGIRGDEFVEELAKEAANLAVAQASDAPQFQLGFGGQLGF